MVCVWVGGGFYLDALLNVSVVKILLKFFYTHRLRLVIVKECPLALDGDQGRNSKLIKVWRT